MFILRIQDRAECGKDTEGGGGTAQENVYWEVFEVSSHIFVVSIHIFKDSSQVGPECGNIGSSFFH